MRGGVPAGEGDWFARNADRRNATAFINTNPAYFAAECASAIKEGRLVLATPTPPIEGRDADVERVEVVARALYQRHPTTFYDKVDGHCEMCWLEATERQTSEYRDAVANARAALQALGDRG